MAAASWPNYFKTPFRVDIYYPEVVRDATGKAVLETTDDIGWMLMQALVLEMNSEHADGGVRHFEHPVYTGNMEESRIDFVIMDIQFRLNVCGWKYLIKKMRPEDAAAVQDEFGQFVVETMKKIGK